MTSVFFSDTKLASDLNPAVFQLISLRDLLIYSRDAAEKANDETGAALFSLAGRALGGVIREYIERG